MRHETAICVAIICGIVCILSFRMAYAAFNAPIGKINSVAICLVE